MFFASRHSESRQEIRTILMLEPAEEKNSNTSIEISLIIED
jgi:hypothetical protein